MLFPWSFKIEVLPNGAFGIDLKMYFGQKLGPVCDLLMVLYFWDQL